MNEVIDKVETQYSANERIALAIMASGDKQAILTTKDRYNGELNTRKIRLGQTADKQVLVMCHGKSRRGNYLVDLDVVSIKPINRRQISKADKWAKQARKLEAILLASGLWTQILEEVQLALAVGWDKLQQANKVQWDDPYETRAARVKAIDERLVRQNEKGEEYIRTDVLRLTVIKIKKMHFGRTNDFCLKGIADAMREGKKHRADGRTAYDVTFEYNPEGKKAYYSEEFRGCGNGHYYLAINATHALFYEDD